MKRNMLQETTLVTCNVTIEARCKIDGENKRSKSLTHTHTEYEKKTDKKAHAHRRVYLISEYGGWRKKRAESGLRRLIFYYLIFG